MGGKNNVGFLRLDGGHHLVNRCRCEGRVFVGAHLAGLEHDLLGRNAAHLENLSPAVAEPAIAQHQALLAGTELAGHGLHAKGAAARHHRHRLGVIDLFQDGGDVTHHALKTLGHVIECAIGVNHRIFKQTIRVHIGQQAGHKVLRKIGV